MYRRCSDLPSKRKQIEAKYRRTSLERFFFFCFSFLNLSNLPFCHMTCCFGALRRSPQTECQNIDVPQFHARYKTRSSVLIVHSVKAENFDRLGSLTKISCYNRKNNRKAWFLHHQPHCSCSKKNWEHRSCLCSFLGPSQRSCVTCMECLYGWWLLQLFSTKRNYEGSNWISIRRFSWLPAASKVELQIQTLLFPFYFKKYFMSCGK